LDSSQEPSRDTQDKKQQALPRGYEGGLLGSTELHENLFDERPLLTRRLIINNFAGPSNFRWLISLGNEKTIAINSTVSFLASFVSFWVAAVFKKHQHQLQLTRTKSQRGRDGREPAPQFISALLMWAFMEALK